MFAFQTGIGVAGDADQAIYQLIMLSDQELGFMAELDLFKFLQSLAFSLLLRAFNLKTRAVRSGRDEREGRTAGN